MTGLELHLSNLLMKRNEQLPQAVNQLPAVYEDGIFLQLGIIVARYNNATGIKSEINAKITSIRQSVENMFESHKRTVMSFSTPNRGNRLAHSYEVYHLVLVSFFVRNCGTYFNETK